MPKIPVNTGDSLLTVREWTKTLYLDDVLNHSKMARILARIGGPHDT